LGIRLGRGGTPTGIPCAVNNHKTSLVNNWKLPHILKQMKVKYSTLAKTAMHKIKFTPLIIFRYC
jgi:hypothetical protein